MNVQILMEDVSTFVPIYMAATTVRVLVIILLMIMVTVAHVRNV